MSACFLGIDLGTSSIKAVLIDLGGQLLASASQEYPTLTPRAGWAEQDPTSWIDTTKLVLKRLLCQKDDLAQRVVAIGFSGQMHGTVCVDVQGNPLRAAIIWADQRSKEEVRWITEKLGVDAVARKTGNPLFPGFMLPTTLWLRKNEPEVWSHCRYFLLPKDYLRYCFTGKFASEPSDASSTSLFDPTTRTWNAELLELVGIELHQMAPLLNSSDLAGELMPAMAAEVGLPAGIPVVCGGSDQACQALGNGIIDPGKISCTIGSGGQLFASLTEPQIDPAHRLHLFCHVLPERWHLLAATLSAGLSFRWLRELFDGCYSYQQMADLAETIPPGSEGLLFAPYLLGERTPYMDPDVRAAFAGLSLHHRKEHCMRAVMEGVVFSLKQSLELMRSYGVSFESVIASGGATHHSLWLHLQVDIFDLPIYVSRSVEPAATGAAMLAAVGTGYVKGLQSAINRMIHFFPPIRARKDTVKIYSEIYQRFVKLYPAIKLAQSK